MASKNSNLSTQAIALPPSPTDAALRNLGQRIAQARRRQGWTQARLAEHIGGHIRTIRRMEAGAPGTAIGHIVQVLQPIHPGLAPLDELQYLSAVPDAARLGALRLPAAGLTWWGRQPRPSNNPAKLSVAVDAAWALETGRASPDDLSALMNRGCFLGGSRPKLTYVLDNGELALVKLPRPSDTYSVPGAEVLALELARRAGIPSAQAQLWIMALVPIAVITRFDRTSGKERLPYVSAATLLNAHEGETRSYVELLEAMVSFCGDFKADAQQLWRRLVFNALITHVDDHWRGIGFLHTQPKGWHLAPAFGLSPTPQQAYRSHAPLSAELGPITSVTMLMRHAHLFALDAQQAKGILRQVVGVTSRWHRWADSRWPLGKDWDLLRPAFEHERLQEAMGLLA